MGNADFTLTNVRCLNEPLFIPSTAGENKNHTMITVIANRGKTKDNKELTTVLPLSFWGSYAAVAACHLKKGRQVNVKGELVSFLMETGAVINGKPQRFLRVEGRAENFEFAGDTKKELAARIDKNIAAFKAIGRIPAAFNVTGEELLAIERDKTQKFDLAAAQMTGMFGNARVWMKGSGFLKPAAAPAPTPNPVVVPAPATPQMVDINAVKAALQKEGFDIDLGVASASPFTGAIAS
jgi:single-stranded DNA-binding protein